MNQIRISAANSQSRRRCPWCHGSEGGDPDWVTCPRDSTPIHRGCLSEFGVCPICRESVNPSGRARVRAQRINVRVSRSHSGSVRLSVLEPREIPTPIDLDDDLLSWAQDLNSVFRPRFPRLGLVLMGLVSVASVVAFFLIGDIYLPGGLGLNFLLYLLFEYVVRRPSPGVLVSGSSSPAFLARAQEIWDRDQEAARRLSAAQNQVNRVGECEERSREIAERACNRYRQFLYSQTPIDDAQRIHGVGPGLVGLLRAHRIRDLRDLQRFGSLTRIHGIGRAKSSLIRSWQRDREAAIERLIQTGQVGAATPDLGGLETEAENNQREARRLNERVAGNLLVAQTWREERQEVIDELLTDLQNG